MKLLRRLLAALRGLFAPRPLPVIFEPQRLGPRFEDLGGHVIRIQEGELAGQEFGLTRTISEEEAHVFLLREGKQIGHCDIQLHAFEATIVLWNIVVQGDLRHKGLASIMTYTAFKRLLEQYSSATFAIRMIRLIRPTERITRVQNIGIGIIARKLGFTPEYNLSRILTRQNIQLVEFIDSDGSMPPAYRIVLKVFPLVLVAFVVDPFNQKPFSHGHPLYNQRVTPETVESWVHDRMIIIGNGNYVLRRDGVPAMVNHLAASEMEATLLARRVKALN